MTLANMNTTVIPQPQPPYSSYLAPADFFLFPKLKSTLNGPRFQTIQEVTENLQTELRAILRRHTRAVSRNGNGVGSGASIQEGITLKAIRLTQLQAYLKNYKKKFRDFLNIPHLFTPKKS
jgi:hypothetical protein